MIEIVRTATFESWFLSLADSRAQARIDIRIRRLSLGNPGDVKPVGDGISEMRIDYGPGYRIYFKQFERRIVILLCGGNKRSQKRDIEHAKRIALQLKE